MGQHADPPGPSARRPSTLLVGGFMGTGKSTVGRIVAALAGAHFVDLDAAIEARTGASIPEIFAASGEGAFRAAEAEALEAELASPGPRVVALGGGALLERARRRDALERARVVTLTASPETLAVRTGGEGRPLLDGAPDRPARIAELLALRAAAYAEAHAVVATDDRSAQSVALAVLAAWNEPRVAVPLAERSYAVRFHRDAAAALAEEVIRIAPTRTLLCLDAEIARRSGSSIAEALAATGVALSATHEVPSGEEHKTLATFGQALEAFVAAGADRGSLVVAVGGGVTTDLAGFAAATLLRGVRWIAAPTTLLAMVDASVGGKTGVDLGQAKNAVGAFHQPSAVVIGVPFVATQSPRDYASGLAEVVKTALVGDAPLLDLLEAEAALVVARDLDLVEEIVRRAIAVKAGIVSRDEREAGERARLNLGHTLGHALEAEGGYRALTHGEAVGLGTIAALRVGATLGVTEAGLADRIEALLDRLGLPTRLDPDRVKAAVALIGLDKKRDGADVRAVLVRRPGDAFTRRFSLSDLASAFVQAAS